MRVIIDIQNLKPVQPKPIGYTRGWGYVIDSKETEILKPLNFKTKLRRTK
jgi:hypothetical protein